MNKATLLSTLLLLISGSALASSYVPMQDSSLYDQADLIVYGTVHSTEVVGDADRPETSIQLDILETLKGSANDSVIEIRQLGGQRADGSGLRIWAAPLWQLGGQVLVFLNSRTDGRYAVSQYMLGAFREFSSSGQSYFVRDLREASAVNPGQNPGQGHVTEGSLSLRTTDGFLTWLRSRSAGNTSQRHYEMSTTDDETQRVYAEYTNITSPGTPVRWFEFDQGQAVPWVADSTPEVDMQGASFTAFSAALAAWNADVGSNINLRDDGLTVARSGLTGSDGRNAILFNDPNNEIFGFFSCSTGGTLAIGGPAYSGSRIDYNGDSYHPITEGDVVTQNGAGCYFVDNANKNGEEVFAHEIGHALGLGHSSHSDALMRSNAHGDGRGAQLGSDDRAAIAFFYEELATPVPDISANPANLNFGNVQIGQSATQSLSLQNQGTANLNIASVVLDSGDFLQNGNCNSANIAAGQSCTIQVSFQPTAPAQAKTATLIINSNDPDQATLNIALSGSAVAVPVPDISTNTSNLDFGSHNIGSSASPMTVTVSNNGDATLTLSSVSLNGANAGSFSQNGGCDAASLSTAQSCDIVVGFTAADPAGGKIATLQISSNDPDEGTVSITLNANSLAVGEAEIDIAPSQLDFADVAIGSSRSLSLNIGNIGGGQLDISEIGLSGTHANQFAAQGCAGQSLPPDQSCSLTITFSPAGDAGSRSATVSISSNDSDEANSQIPLSGLAVTDADTDGIEDTVEANAPNNGDGNNDGFDDAQQNDVSSFVGDSGSYLTLETSAGQLDSVTIEDNPAPENTPASLAFPEGFINFNITGLTPGATATVVLTVHGETSPSSYYKFGPTAGNNVPHLYEFLFDGQTGAQISGNRITLTFVDGGRGDSDLLTDGNITDPGAPATSAAAPATEDDSGGGGGGGCTMQTTQGRADLGMLILLLGSLVYLSRRRRLN